MKASAWFGFVLALVAISVPGVAVCAPVPDGNAPKLVWKAFDQKGKPFYQTLVTKTEQKMTVMDMDVTQVQDQTFYIRWMPLAADAKGNWVIEQRIIGVKMKIDIGGNKIDYDSTTLQPMSPMRDFFEALVGLELKFVIRPKDMKVERIDGNQEFIAKLEKTNPSMGPLLKSILSEDALRKMSEPTLFAFPLDDKNEWDRTSHMDLGPIGSYETGYKFKRGEQKDGKVRVGVTATMKYSPPKADDKGKLPFTIDSGELTGKDGTGHALFDVKKGRFDRYEMKMNLDGKLTIDIGGTKTIVILHQEQAATVITSDIDPLIEARRK